MAQEREESANPFAAPEAAVDQAEDREAEPEPAPPEEEQRVAAEDRVLLGAAATVIEAETIASALRGRGIRVALVDNQTVGASGVIGGALAGVKIYTVAADLERAKELLAKAAGAGKPVFIVQRGPVGAKILGIFAGAGAGVIAAMILSMPLLIVPGMILGWFAGSRMKGATYCSSPRCGAALELDTKVCPGCGGVVSGVIGHPDERLEAEERLRAGSPSSSESSSESES
jgi:hypothetical protein